MKEIEAAICGRVGGEGVRNDGWDGLWLDDDQRLCDVVVQIGTNTQQHPVTQ